MAKHAFTLDTIRSAKLDSDEWVKSKKARSEAAQFIISFKPWLSFLEARHGELLELTSLDASITPGYSGGLCSSDDQL